jgi:hypothetical protein
MTPQGLSVAAIFFHDLYVLCEDAAPIAFGMLVFKSDSWSLKDQKVLAWLSKQPLKIEQ